MDKKIIEFPEMRQSLIFYIDEISSQDISKVWELVKGQAGNIDFLIHFLYDDTSLADNPNVYIGKVLKGQEEADLVSELVSSLDSLFDKYGLSLSDEDYISKPEWREVRVRATRLVRLLKSQ